MGYGRYKRVMIGIREKTNDSHLLERETACQAAKGSRGRLAMHGVLGGVTRSRRCLARAALLCAVSGYLPFQTADAAAAEIEIYTASYCGECKRAKAYMHEKGIAFDERDVEKDIDRRREFYARGGKAIPYIVVRGQAMHGFDAEQFERLRSARN